MNTFLVIDYDYIDPEEREGKKDRGKGVGGEEREGKKKWSLECPLVRYCENALEVGYRLKKEFQRMYRVVPGL